MIALYAMAVVALTAFILVENRIEHPMLDLHMFRSRDFSVGLFARFAIFATIAGVAILFPFYLTDVLGLAPLGVGFAMAALPFAMGSTAPLAGAWSDRNGVRRVSMFGLLILVVAFVTARLVIGTNTAILAFIGMAFPLGLGFGTFQSPNSSAVMGSVGLARLGVAASLITITRITGWITGVAVMARSGLCAPSPMRAAVRPRTRLRRLRLRG